MQHPRPAPGSFAPDLDAHLHGRGPTPLREGLTLVGMPLTSSTDLAFRTTGDWSPQCIPRHACAVADAQLRKRLACRSCAAATATATWPCGLLRASIRHRR
jgi:hypothetical protein